MYENVLFWLVRVNTVATETQQWVIFSIVTLLAAFKNIYFENGTLYYFYIDKLLSLEYSVCFSAYTFSVTVHTKFATDHMKIFLLLAYSFGSILYHCMYGCTFCMFSFNFVNYVFLLLCTFRSRY